VTERLYLISESSASFEGSDPVACHHSYLIWKYESYLHFVGLLWQGISLLQGRCLLRKTQTQKKAYKHAPKGIKTHDPSA
jgi:hypothetical protein